MNNPSLSKIRPAALPGLYLYIILFNSFIFLSMNLFKKNFTIMLAEDDAEEHSRFIRALNDPLRKINIDSVYNGMQLIDHLLIRRKNLPDLIISDLYMPFAGGLQVLKQVRARVEFRQIPIYVFSKNFDNTIRTNVLENGATDFFKKPGDFADLQKIINGILEKTITPAIT